MGNIKSKFCALLILIMISLTLISFLSIEICSAEEVPFNISIMDEPTYKLTNSIKRNGRILGRAYQISVIFTNTGYQKSEEIEVNLTDQEGYVLTQRTFFNPGETKTIIFNWSTIIDSNQKLTVHYYPSNIDTSWNKFNSGKESFTIKVNDGGMKGTSTPGFEIFFLIVAISFVAISIKRKH